ncbi:hypothetical protein G9A89_003473 [Geosiphon pyriformis]|nr:hypothetical protein G9A89_003473 [Geosiphon pyriformis]
MAYASIAKLEKFTGKEDDAQVWLNDVEKAITANGWNDYQSLANKPQDFIAFKLAFLQYFSNNNSINRLANTFTTIKQGENEAVTTYLRCFHRNLHQIQAIQADYFIVPQILNQFIRGLYSSTLQCVCPMHPVDLQAAINNARNFEVAELEANHVQTEPNQKQPLTNIPPATVIEDEFLAAIFPFEIKEPIETSLFSGAVLEKKPIMAMYTDAKIDGQFIKLILNSESAGSIITRQLMDQLDCQTPIDEIDNLSIEINALVGNDWLSKINATLDWNTQELQLSQNG